MVALLAASHTWAVDGKKNHEMPPYYEGSSELQKMKTLAGAWSGEHKMGDQVSPGDATYKITSNGSAVVETLMPGTPMEMISIYFDDKKGKLNMVHYCSLANQPKLDLIESKGNKIILDFSEDNDIDVATEMHMHGLTIIFNEDGTVKHEWVSYQDGKEAGIAEITLIRK